MRFFVNWRIVAPFCVMSEVPIRLRLGLRVSLSGHSVNRPVTPQASSFGKIREADAALARLRALIVTPE